MNLGWYNTFIVLCKHLNYRKASEELFLSQPSIYQQIKKLEQHLKIELFHTVGRNIQLSEQGKRFLPLAKNFVNEYKSHLEQFRRNECGIVQLNVVVCSYVATYLMPKFLPLLFEKEPNISVSVFVKNKNLISYIENNVFDIGILREKPFKTKLNCEKICEGKVKLIVPNTKENKNFKDENYYFNKYKIIANNHPSYWGETLDAILSIAPQANIISIEDVKVSERLIESNQGVSYLPTYILDDSNNGKLRVIEPKLISSPISFTYIVNIKNTVEINKFKSLFKEFIISEQNK
ncbi:LysR family transcriptional regulator [Orbaceae bacterium ac157xtp]